MTGVSPIDCALWDLKGKHFDLPVYRLLGGPTRSEVPAYASMAGFSIEPEEAARTAVKYKEEGFTAQKWFVSYGPAHGEEGLKKNRDLAFALREALGEHYQIMFDAFMAWDLNYTYQMVRILEPIRPRWLEEPVPPERVGVFQEIKRAAGFPIATGEHVYTRWQVRQLLEARAIDVLQTDPDWTGGITELTKINALASSYEVPVIAHGHSLLAALHVAAAQSPASVPLVEFLIRTQPQKQFFHKPIYWPEKGSLKLPDLPGLGLVLDAEKIKKKERVSFELRGEAV
jgi:L-alanine-DL-glutamate epimerase-like enolase superfamily enzyme